MTWEDEIGSFCEALEAERPVKPYNPGTSYVVLVSAVPVYVPFWSEDNDTDEPDKFAKTGIRITTLDPMGEGTIFYCFRSRTFTVTNAFQKGKGMTLNKLRERCPALVPLVLQGLMEVL